MPIDRRNLLALSAITASAPAAAMAMAAPAIAAPLASLGVDARSLGVRAGGGAMVNEFRVPQRDSACGISGRVKARA